MEWKEDNFELVHHVENQTTIPPGKQSEREKDKVERKTMMRGWRSSSRMRMTRTCIFSQR